MSLTEGLPTLLGVVIGGGVSFGSAAFTDRARYRREQTARARDTRLAAYTEFAVATRQTISLLFRLAAFHGADDQQDPLMPDEAKTLFAEAFHRRVPVFERVRLIGSLRVAEASRKWVRSIHECRDYLAIGKVERMEWQRLVAEMNRARDGFHAAARTELGINDDGGSSTSVTTSTRRRA